jgi:hypothetical protein
MPRRASKRKEDTNQIAARVVAQSTGQPVPELSASEEKKLRSQAASILGRLGGSKGGKIRAANLSPERRQEIAKKAANSRWTRNGKKR